MNGFLKHVLASVAALVSVVGLRGMESTPLSALDLDCVVHVRSRIAPPPRPGKTVSGNPISIGGRKFTDGFGMHGISRLQIELDGRASRFTAWTGLTDDSPDPGPVWYEILGDGRMLYEGAPIKRGEAAKEINLDINGIKSLVLAVQSPDYFNVHTAWADARISYEGETPKAVIPPREKPYILTPPTPREPRINGAAVFGVRPGSPVLFQVASTGDGPMRFSATSLPSGLALDAQYARPGRWNDPDIMVVGHVGWHAARRPSRLTPDEQYTHVSLWSLLAAPLLIGCDLTKLDDFTLNLITNDEVIAVNQDPLGRAARRVARDRNLEVWARPLADGSVAVGLFNRGELPAKVTARWDNLGIHGARVVRDLWRQQDLGSFAGGFSAEVPRHGVVFVKLYKTGKTIDKNKQGE